MLPINGKNGYFIWSGEEIPIYSWIFSAINTRPTWKLSNTENYPIRISGIGQESLSIKGVDFFPAFYISDSIISEVMNFEIGWMDFDTLIRRKIAVSALMSEYVMSLNYMNSNLPSFMWTANFIGCSIDKEFDIDLWLDINDHVRCQPSLCDRTIFTTDSTLNSGFVQHVRNATLTRMFVNAPLVLSNSNNHFSSETLGTYDTTVDLTIEGDFDYWLDQINTDNRFDYRFQYTQTEYFPMSKMKALELTNLVVNIQTSEIISAVVRLGASYE